MTYISLHVTKIVSLLNILVAVEHAYPTIKNLDSFQLKFSNSNVMLKIKIYLQKEREREKRGHPTSVLLENRE